jgi:hypothetical protein
MMIMMLIIMVDEDYGDEMMKMLIIMVDGDYFDDDCLDDYDDGYAVDGDYYG